MTWTNRNGFMEIQGRECVITIEARPRHCDRGNFIAKLFPRKSLAREIDEADAWPRYYFDLARAKLEVEAWLDKRGQRLPAASEEPEHGEAEERG